MQDADEGKPFPDILQALEDIEKKPRQGLLSRLFPGSESDDKPGVDGDTALSLGHELHLACQYGEAEWARKALEKGAPVDGRSTSSVGGTRRWNAKHHRKEVEKIKV